MFKFLDEHALEMPGSPGQLFDIHSPKPFQLKKAAHNLNFVVAQKIQTHLLLCLQLSQLVSHQMQLTAGKIASASLQFNNKKN